MFYAISWLVVSSLLALWSLAVWAVQSITAWTVSNAGDLAASAGVTQGLPMPEWLAPWVPPELAPVSDSMASALLSGIQAVLGWAPSLEAWLSVAVWVVWGIGSVLLIMLGVLATGLIAALRRGMSAPGTPAGGAAAAR